jgi:hypothetical protein
VFADDNFLVREGTVALLAVVEGVVGASRIVGGGQHTEGVAGRGGARRRGQRGLSSTWWVVT